MHSKGTNLIRANYDKTEVFLRTLYDNCREDQVEAVKNKIKRDRQLRLATANGGPRNEAPAVASLIKRPKLRECFAWVRTGKCGKGDECSFAHQDIQPSAETRKLDKKRRRDADSGGVDTKSLKKEQKLEADSVKKALRAAKTELGPRKEAKPF